MSEAASRYAVGVIHYGAYPELPGCLAAIDAQTDPPRWVRVLDADCEPDRLDRAVAQQAHIELESIPNRGYAYGANRLIERATQDPECEHLLLLNPDVVLEPGFATAMLAAMDSDEGAALAGGRLIRRDGRTLDSAGIWLGRNRRPRDRASDERDVGQYSEPEVIFGASGAALWLRLAAARDLAVEGEVFDEDFFLYHEDTDVAWRAALYGWRVLYVPNARAMHERGWKRATRFQIPRNIRRHSFKNHSLQMIKNDRLNDWLRDLPIILGWEFLRLSFALVRDRAVLGAYADTLRLARRVLHKRRIVQARARGRVRFGRT